MRNEMKLQPTPRMVYDIIEKNPPISFQIYPIKWCILFQIANKWSLLVKKGYT